MIIYIKMIASKLLLSILWTEYETPALGERVISWWANVDGYTEAGYTTLERARSVIIIYWKGGSSN
jgi:hypothetical protein